MKTFGICFIFVLSSVLVFGQDENKSKNQLGFHFSFNPLFGNQWGSSDEHGNSNFYRTFNVSYSRELNRYFQFETGLQLDFISMKTTGKVSINGNAQQYNSHVFYNNIIIPVQLNFVTPGRIGFIGAFSAEIHTFSAYNRQTTSYQNNKIDVINYASQTSFPGIMANLQLGAFWHINKQWLLRSTVGHPLMLYSIKDNSFSYPMSIDPDVIFIRTGLIHKF